MNIQVQTQGFALTPAVSAWAGSRISRVLKPLADEVLQVEAFLIDASLNGEDDKRALVRVRLGCSAPVVAESDHSDLYTAIDQSARSARLAIQQQLKQ